MQYILLIYANEAEYAQLSPEQYGQMNKQYMDFTESIKQSGHYKAGEPLEPTSMATTVRVKSGRTVKTDGPFAETREQLGGFYIIDAKDLDDAVAVAARIPVGAGCVEVRPLMQLPGA